jgi:hypothetical protein
MKVFLEFDFNKFEREVLRKPKTLDGLDTLEGNIIKFEKYCKPCHKKQTTRYSHNIVYLNGALKNGK